MNNNLEILKNILQSENLPNLLIYPDNGEKIFYNEFYKIYNICKEEKIECGEITYIKTNIYYEFNLKYIINRQVNTLIEIIKEIIYSKNFFSEKETGIILFKNFNSIKISLQNILRVIIEKYRKTTVFIFFTDKYNSIIEPLRSRFLCLRFPNKTHKELRKIIYDNSDKKLKSSEYYDFMYSMKDSDDILKIIDKEKQIEIYRNPYDIISKEILDIYTKKKIIKKDYLKLKDCAYNILKNNININILYKSLLSFIIDSRIIRDNTKYKIIKLFAISEYDIIRSYRNIIILESLLINIYYMIKDDLL
jgi:DNA polymerase III delta prime subunit